jgi:hypothetical protein
VFGSDVSGDWIVASVFVDAGVADSARSDSGVVEGIEDAHAEKSMDIKMTG